VFPRALQPPDSSLFLFGARGTGQTAWIHQHFASTPAYDPRSTSEALRLSREPELLREECSTSSAGSWVVIDEVQRVPALFDEVQHLITKQRLRFVRSGSSARKLKRSGANLLAGRAEVRRMFPLVSNEAKLDDDLDDVLARRRLRIAVTGGRPSAFLRSHSEVYIEEEVQAEALVRQIAPFHRFLEVAARVNAQTVNVSGIARDAGIDRQTATRFFEILVESLIATWLPAWKLKRGVKELSHPKFFLFDTGITRQIAGRGHLDIHPEERGSLLETLVVHELRAYLNDRELELPFAYWAVHGGQEVDFVVETRNGLVAIEV
jgi:predicted AAA+ superfamily ATPase